MSVSNHEKHFIITGELDDEKNSENLWTLSDDVSQFKDFTQNENSDDLDEIWSKYVRKTHAYRSAEKVRRYFEPINKSISEAASKICEGHGIAIEDLQNPGAYPTNRSVLGEAVNLRALAVYLRLIDLLDLAEDRTPYLIWKFVAPRNQRSKLEWAKHRALNQVTFPQYQEGRSILIDGSTDDHEVYAALEDLRAFCETQFQGLNDILAQMNDQRHKLDLFNIIWRVETRGFEKRSIRFEFDREQMFRILSEELYQNDPYVFLRELLQNSIDAIHMRREILQNLLGMDTKNFGLIKVDVKHESDGNAIINWSDNGIGMDEFIIKNYLAVVGKSYYRSNDFQIYGLKMDPIARFGIGILSCFSVADRIEIETLRDRNLQPESLPLRIIIPDELRFFRIETPAKDIDIGTTIRIFVEGNKVHKADSIKPFKPLDVTGYLSTIAGFVDIPILVNENNSKVLILSPMEDPTVAVLRFGNENKIQQLDFGYPLEETVCPQDYYESMDILKEEHVNISSDLGMKGYEGVLSYLIPANDSIDILYGHEVSFRDRSTVPKKLIRFSDESMRSAFFIKGLSRSSAIFKLCSVYMNGILLSSSDLQIPNGIFGRGYGPRYLPLPRISLNIIKPRMQSVDLARTRFEEEDEHWSKPIFSAYIRYIIDKSIDKLLSLDPIERAYQLGRISIFHNIEPEFLWQAFPQDYWPFIFLDENGCFIGDEWINISNDPINYFPYCDTGDFLFFSDMSRTQLSEFYSKWRGDKILIQHNYYKFPNSTAGTTAQYLWSTPIEQNYCLGAIRFLNPPWEGYPPFFQKIIVLRETNDSTSSIEDLLKKAIENPFKLNPTEIEKVSGLFRKRERLFADAIVFPAPFRSFAFGNLMMNLAHPSGKTLFQFRAALELSKLKNELSSAKIGRLTDALNSFDLIKKSFYFKWERFTTDLTRIYNLANEYHLLEIDDVDRLIPSIEEFVPGTLELNYRNKMDFYNAKFQHISKNIRIFGMHL